MSLLSETKPCEFSDYGDEIGPWQDHSWRRLIVIGPVALALVGVRLWPYISKSEARAPVTRGHFTLVLPPSTKTVVWAGTTADSVSSVGMTTYKVVECPTDGTVCADSTGAGGKP